MKLDPALQIRGWFGILTMMKTATHHRFTVEEYYRMAETGILQPDVRVELLDGEIHDMSPIGPLHGGVLNRLIRLFASLARGRWLVSAQNPARLDNYSEPQPDLMLLKPAPDDYTSHHPFPDDVLLLIEIADSSLLHDRKRKVPAYARASIPEVWIVNLTNRSIEVYTDPQFTNYGSIAILGSGDKAVPQAFSDVSVDVSELLK
jgi:Uma2 family endonuclease